MSEDVMIAEFETAYNDIKACSSMTLTQLGEPELVDFYTKLLHSLEAMTSFDPNRLARSDLGANHNFQQAVEPAQRIIQIYSAIKHDSVRELSFEYVKKFVLRVSDNMKLFLEIIRYTNVPQQLPSSQARSAQPSQAQYSDPNVERNKLLQQVSELYEKTFNASIIPWIYSNISCFDLATIQTQANSIFQQHAKRIADKQKELEKLVEQVSKTKSEAETVLASVQKTAAELGVSQQASHFRKQAKYHENTAKIWLGSTIFMSVLIVAYAVLSLFFHTMFCLDVSDKYIMLQLAVSKVLIFAVLSFMLYLSSKNYMTHRHNYIVNRHREKALETFNVLVDSASENVNKDIVLKCAADCIFLPQPTGYMGKNIAEGAGSDNIINLLSSAVIPSEK